MSSRLLVSRVFQQFAKEKTSSKHRDHIGTLADSGVAKNVHNALFCLLPTGVRILEKLIKYLDHRMKSIGAEKIILPSLCLKDLWDKSGRFEAVGKELMTVKDRHGKVFCLCPTHEESITSMLASFGHTQFSEKALPLMLYQITSKFRDEPNPRTGLLRSREFVMKDLYTFDVDTERAMKTYELVSESYDHFFRDIQLPVKKVVAHTGTIGGSLSHEHHVLNELGEDFIFVCPSCQFGVNKEVVQAEEATCDNCGAPCKAEQSIEVGHTFLLGTKYSAPLQANCLTAAQKVVPMQMGCYGVGVSRILGACLNVFAQNDCVKWPLPLAPYLVSIVPQKKGFKSEVTDRLATELYDYFLEQKPTLAGQVIIDDRTRYLSIGKRVQDSSRLGIPFIVVLGKQALEDEPKLELIDTLTGTSVHDLTFQSIADAICFKTKNLLL